MKATAERVVAEAAMRTTLLFEKTVHLSMVKSLTVSSRKSEEVWVRDAA
jgi:hypothetical protein